MYSIGMDTAILVQEEYIHQLTILQRKLDYQSKRLVEAENALREISKQLDMVDKYLACI